DATHSHMSSALALIRSEPRLAAMHDHVSRRLALGDRQLAERKGRDAARARLAAFERSYDEAVFYQSQYTGLEPEANLRASRSAARRALGLFDPNDGTGTGTGLALTPGEFDAAEIAVVTERHSELTLILAE